MRRIPLGILVVVGAAGTMLLAACVTQSFADTASDSWCLPTATNCTAAELGGAGIGCNNYPPQNDCVTRTCMQCANANPAAYVKYCSAFYGTQTGCTYTGPRDCGRKMQRSCTLSATTCYCPSEGGTDVGACQVMVCGT